jgi:RNA polymerase sigma-70 factor, ECF subfamily
LTAIVVDHQPIDLPLDLTVLAEQPAVPAALVGREGALSFESFYVANERRLFRALFVVTGNRHEAEDLMQTAFCKVLERWEKVADLDDPVGYLFRTAFNTHRSAVRRTMRAARRVVPWSPDRQAPPEPAEVAEMRDRAVRALGALTRRQREAVVLTALLGYGRNEAARIMGIRPATVRVLVSQARAALVGARGDDT